MSRFYIDRFMNAHRDDITGTVLEIKNPRYANSLGSALKRVDILDIDTNNRHANIFTDLATADCLPSNTYDCFMINETLQFVYDLQSAVRHAHRSLRPGGILLVTVPCTAQHDSELKDVEFWRFTRTSCERLFGDVFGQEMIEVETYGNFASCVTGLTGMAVEENDPAMYDNVSPIYVQGVCVRAQKKREIH